MTRLLRRVLTGLALLSLAATPGLAAEKVKVGIMGGDSEEIWHEVQKVATADGIDIQLVVFNDYTLPNAALDAGDLDLNAFQHQPYLDAQIKARGYKIVAIGKTIVTPIGLYSHKVKSIAELRDGAVIGIPNDPTNGGRGLLLLQAQGFLKLKPGTGLTPTPLDITASPKDLTIRELDAAQLPRSLDDLDAAVINTNYALQAGLNPRKDAIAIESAENNPYDNLIAAREKDRDNPLYLRVVKAFQDPRIRDFINKRWDGAQIPVF
ncbi:MAG: D-methionine transport system substrate-binding protein [Rhodospirillaceae bacterium]|jgi:D-methionine transport system substrate-binding protein|nr:D-methionine transport system substrate-binding protein [Rhodospirillaceae bacterium]